MDHSELLDRLSITEEDAAFFKNDNPGLCRVDTSRISSLLLAQLASVRKHRVLNSFAVTDVIQRLEGAELGGNAKAEESFKIYRLEVFGRRISLSPGS